MVTVFISYTHSDERLKERFLVHLGALRRENLIGVWHDRMLRPGEHLDDAIEKELATADFVILLISPDFINSDYCIEKEMQRAFARARDEQCKVAPIILKPCQWKNIPIEGGGQLGDFVAMPRDGKPVTQWSHRDKAWNSVVAGIRALITNQSASSTGTRTRQEGGASPPAASAIYGKRDAVPGGDLSRCSKLSQLFDYLVGAQKERFRDSEAECFGGP